MKKTKTGQINFTVLFAVIAGAAILFLAIYGAIKLGGTERQVKDVEIAKQITILINPLQAGFAEGIKGEINFRQEARIRNRCFSGGFGRNEIGVSTRADVGEPWLDVTSLVPVYNKYIFSDFEEGEIFYVFSTSFNFPYKVADLTILTSNSKNFCFVNPPEKIRDFIEGLGIPNVEIGDARNCSRESEKICFGTQTGCDDYIYGTCISDCNSLYDEGYVDKKDKRLYYNGNLIYGAIFSDSDTYECNVNRLMYRTKKIAEIYADKAEIMNARECNTNLKTDLNILANAVSNAEMEDLITLSPLSKEIDNKNNKELCKIW